MLAAASVTKVAKAQESEAPIDRFFRESTDEWMRHNPGAATSARYFTGEERDRLARTSQPRTRATQLERIGRARTLLTKLRAIDRSKFTDLQRVSADQMDWLLSIMVEGERYLDYDYPLQQMNGVNINLVEGMTVTYPVLTERDAENYVYMLGFVDKRLDEAVAEAKQLAAKKIVPPRFILQATIRQMENFTDSSPAQNPFVTAFDEKLAAIKDLSPAKREKLRADAAKIVAEKIYPAWKRGAALLQSQLAASSDAAGLGQFKGGDEAYAYNLRRYTTTKLTPDEIHRIGLDRVKSIESQMDVVFRKLGRTDGSVKDRVEKLRLDLQYPNPSSEASRELIMKDIDGIIRDAEKRAAAMFDIRPKTPVVARPFPSFRENNAAANYNSPAPDGSRPGVFQYPRRISNMTKFSLRSTVYHETVPGHHFQLALQVENKALPRFRQIGAFGGISAFSEGWGLYAERLAAESGWYDDDPEGLLGALDSELFRARRLVVDTGIHSKGWTRQQGIDFGIEPSEVERYCVYPGQACSYMMGQLKLIESREKAKAALGAKFSLREYHNKVLTMGTVPLELLEREVESWIKSQA